MKEEYIKHYIYGLVGKHTWKEELRGYAVDHTQAADRGPLSPTLTGKLPPINVNNQEALLLGSSHFHFQYLLKLDCSATSFDTFVRPKIK